MVRYRLVVAVACSGALLLAACGGGGGGGDAAVAPPTPSTGDVAFVDSTLYSSAGAASLPSEQEGAAVTHHSLNLGGAAAGYTATAGHLTAKDPITGVPEASFFYVAYTLDKQTAATRPVTFFYNGGPGSATLYLHLGSFGPRRLATGAPSASPPMPFPLVDNAETLLDITDLVYVDAVGTGYSEAIQPYTNRNFWGVDADANVFRDFVVRYLNANQRNASPKFLFGESYGTLRSAVLANVLESAGVTLNGVVLQSSVLNYNANCGLFDPVVLSCAGYLPTYAAVGAYYGLENPNPVDVNAALVNARAFATAQFAPAVTAFLAAGTAPPPGLIDQLVALTGAPAALWIAHFDLDPSNFQTGLIPGTIIGRYDARISAPRGSALAAEGDPSSTLINNQFVSALAGYLPSFLQYTAVARYTALSDAIDVWNFRHDGLAAPDAIPDLGAALAQNPRLKVLALSGYDDLATPFFQTELDLARLGNSPNIEIDNFPGGHMTYLDDGSRQQEKAVLARFYRAALAGTP